MCEAGAVDRRPQEAYCNARFGNSREARVAALSQIQGVIRRLPTETSGIQRMCTDLSMDGDAGFAMCGNAVPTVPDASDEISCRFYPDGRPIPGVFLELEFLTQHHRT